MLFLLLLLLLLLLLNIYPKYFSVSDPYRPVIIIYKNKKRASIGHNWKPTVLRVRCIILSLLQQLFIIAVFTWKFLQITFYSFVVVVVFLHSVQLNTWYWSTSCFFFSPIWFDFSQMPQAVIGPRPTLFSCDIFDRVLGAVMFFSTNAVFIGGSSCRPQF